MRRGQTIESWEGVMMTEKVLWSQTTEQKKWLYAIINLISYELTNQNQKTQDQLQQRVINEEIRRRQRLYGGSPAQPGVQGDQRLQDGARRPHALCRDIDHKEGTVQRVIETRGFQEEIAEVLGEEGRGVD